MTARAKASDQGGIDGGGWRATVSGECTICGEFLTRGVSMVNKIKGAQVCNEHVRAAS